MNNNVALNIVFIGQQTFPDGSATTKRRRNLIDYLNDNKISNHVLVTYYHNSHFMNPSAGRYNDTDYLCLHDHLARKNIIRYYKEGKAALKKWHDQEKKNILIFPTVITAFDLCFFIYAKKLGYHIVFDQVETSYLKSGHLKPTTKMYYWINEKISNWCYKRSAAFAISTALINQIKMRFPERKVALLPNSSHFIGNKKERNRDYCQILYSGTYGEKEGVSYLIEGVKKAHDKGVNCQLILLGKAPEDLIQRYCNLSMISFKGFVSEEALLFYLRDSDILAMVRTNTEFANYGFPYKLSESLATGNAVMATKVGDVENYLTNMEDSYLVNPENSEEICNTILRVVTHPEEALKIGKMGLKVMEKHFSISSVGEEFVKFLSSI